jgi:hypothetical protein
MLFTKATEAGIQLENALILSPEQYKKAQIPANNKRILEWARDNHVNLNLNAQAQSGFNCTLGIMMGDCISDNTMSTNKRMLMHLGENLTKHIDDMPDQVEDATKEAETRKKLQQFVEDFEAGVKAICGEDTIVEVKVFKMRDIDPDELAHILAKAFECHE